MMPPVLETKPSDAPEIPSYPRGDIRVQLQPVVSSLARSARNRAERVLSAADADCTAELASAHDEAKRILQQARTQGAAAAEATGIRLVIRARREAREMVLRAQKRVYEDVRTRAIDALQLKVFTPEGRYLSEFLERVVNERVGEDTHGCPTELQTIGATAERDNRRASIRAADLIDRAMSALSTEIESLWS